MAQSSQRPKWLLAAAALAGLLAAGAYLFRLQWRVAPPAPKAEASYADPAACAGCHHTIWETYRRTGMGRSFYRPRAGNTPDGAFHHRASQRSYRIYQSDGRYFQRRHQLGPDGKETNFVEKEIHFVIGSGNHTRTYLQRTPEGRIVELPVAWYPARGGYWAMNPGYDRPNHADFRRRIAYECMFCHNAYPDLEPGADSSGSEPLFPARLPEGIDCQRCHGPGRDHLRAIAEQKPAAAVRQAIVNPARLSRELQLELCLQCHMETTSFQLPHSILRYQRGAFSYRPGEPLGDYILHFDHPAGAGHDDKFEIAHHGYRLMKSPCFAQSNGRMTCTTCHNPHDVPRGENAVAHYVSVCRSCHAKPHNTTNCLPCHMPKRRTDDVVHVVMTDHFIQRRKPARDLLAPLAEIHDTGRAVYRGEVALSYPPRLASDAEGELYQAVAQVKQFTNLKEGILRLEAAIATRRPARAEFYFELAEAYWENGQREKALATYEEAIRRGPGFWPALHGFGKALAKAGHLARAEDALTKALAIVPRNATVLNDLGLVYIAQNRPKDAAETLRRSVGIDPDFPDAHNNLGGALAAVGDSSGAEAAYREAIGAQPDFAAAHKNLASLLAARGDFSRADYHYRKAIQLDPNYAAARYDYGLALARQQRFDQARPHFEAAARLDPKRAEVHNALGDLAAMKGRIAEAAGHYRRAVAVKPDYHEAHLNLGELLATTGQAAQALPHLRKAAESPDRAVREAAGKAMAPARP